MEESALICPFTEKEKIKAVKIVISDFIGYYLNLKFKEIISDFIPTDFV